MHFNEYLKSCREHNRLTQEQLVNDLYSYDIDTFEGLDTSTLSKWERAKTKPSLSKQVSIVKYFQDKTGVVLPCWNQYSIEEAESRICKTGTRNLLGKSKTLIYTFPSEMMSVDDIHIYPLRTFERMDTLINTNMHLHRSYIHEFAQLSKEQFKEFALHPDSLFLTCEYEDAFLGYFFSIKVKQEVFDKVLNFEMKRSEITTDDFASFDEVGSNLMIAFFAMNEKAAVLLVIRYYAHLIANQKYISEIGGISNFEEGIKLVSNMNLQYHSHYTTDDNIKIKGYRQTLPNVLASEHVVNMLLSKQDCPEE